MSVIFSDVWWRRLWHKKWPTTLKRQRLLSTLTSRCGCECIAHAVQALTDADPESTVLSIDGIGAFDLISRASMLIALKDAPGCDRALPFVRQFYGCPSNILWEDEDGMDHETLQGVSRTGGPPHASIVRTGAAQGPRRCAGRNASDHEVDASQILLPTSNDLCGNTQASGSTWARRRSSTGGTFCPKGANTSCKPGGN